MARYVWHEAAGEGLSVEREAFGGAAADVDFIDRITEGAVDMI